MSLPEPTFIARDPNAVTAELIAFYEALTGKVLQPAQPEMLLINLVAYRESLLRIAIQETGKQCLVNYASFPMLDYLGELVNCQRMMDESDDHYRDRIKAAPEAFSVAGSTGAYKYWSKSAHPDIVDVAVTSPAPGEINVFPLMSSGNPSAEILDLVYLVLSADKVRPLTDNLDVLAPTQIDFTVSAGITLYAWADTDSVTNQIDTGLNAYTAGLKRKLGGDIVCDQIIGIIRGVYGVYKAGLTIPATDRVLAANEWANCTAITITIAGYVNG